LVRTPNFAKCGSNNQRRNRIWSKAPSRLRAPPSLGRESTALARTIISKSEGALGFAYGIHAW